MKTDFSMGGVDLTLIVLIDRRVGLSLSRGRGYGDEFYSVAMEIWDAHSVVRLADLGESRCVHSCLNS